jgi:hypothetical protein
MRLLYATVVEAVLSGFAFLLVTGEYFDEGRVVVVLTRAHGLHSGDLFVLAGWALATAALVGLALPARRRSASAPRRMPGRDAAGDAT